MAAQAEAAAAGSAPSDLGKRAERGAAMERSAAAMRAALDERRARFDNALDKANWASAMLRPQVRRGAHHMMGARGEGGGGRKGGLCADLR